MRRRPVASAAFDFETFGASTGLAWMTGGLSLVIPGLLPLIAALGALAVAGWATRFRRQRAVPPRGASVALAVVGGLVGLALFVAPPQALMPYRGLGVGFGLLPLWLVARDRHASPVGLGSGAPR